MAAIAQRVAVGAAAAAQQNRGRLAKPQFVGHPATAQVGAIAEPAVTAAAAAAELVDPGRQLKRLRARDGGFGLGHMDLPSRWGLTPVWST
jgi:hypothetical protein